MGNNFYSPHYKWGIFRIKIRDAWRGEDGKANKFFWGKRILEIRERGDVKVGHVQSEVLLCSKRGQKLGGFQISLRSFLKRERKLGIVNCHHFTTLCFGHATDVISSLNYTDACVKNFWGTGPPLHCLAREKSVIV